jgi:hypothetical protein
MGVSTKTKRELNQQTATILAMVTPEDPVVITERGTAKWKIQVVDTSGSTLNGVTFTPATKKASWDSLPLHGVKQSTAELLDELREERV